MTTLSPVPAQQCAPATAGNILAATAARRYKSPRKELARAKREIARLDKRIANAIVRGDMNTARHLTSVRLKSRAAKIVSAAEASKKRRRKGRPHSTGARLIDSAETISAIGPTKETVLVRSIKKQGEGFEPTKFRTVQAFGEMDQARQILVRDAMRPFMQLDPRQYMHGGGRDAAIQKVMELMPTHRWAVEVDIKDFYPTVDGDWLRQSLPMAGQIVEDTLLNEHDETQFRGKGFGYSMRYHTEAGVISSRSRLPQGGASSSLIAEYVVAEIMKHVPAGVPIVNYADNFLVMGRTLAETETSLKTLVAAATQCPAGAFQMKSGKMSRVASGVEFIGYKLKSIRGKSDARPTKQKLKDFQKEAAKIIRKMYHGIVTGSATLARYIAGFKASFKHWKERDSIIWYGLRELAMCLPSIRRSIMEACSTHFPAMLRKLEEAVACATDASTAPT